MTNIDKNINPEPSKPLESYFNAFSEQKVDFSMRSVENLIQSHSSAYASAGFFAKLISRFGIKTFTAVTSIAVLMTGSIILLTSNIFKDSEKQIVIKEKSNSITKKVNTEKGVESSLNQIALQSANKDNKNTQKISNSSSNRYNFSEKRLFSNEDIPDKIYIQGDVTDKFISPSNDLAEFHEIQLPSSTLINQAKMKDEKFAFVLMADDIRTIFNTYVTKNSYWIEVATKATGINGSVGFLSGGKIGWTANKNFTTGLFLYGLNQKIKADIFTNTTNFESGDLAVMYGGVMLEYTFNPDEMIHYNAGISIGAGGYGLRNNQRMTTVKPFAIIEPGVGIEATVTRYLRIGLEGQYRFASEMKFNDLNRNSNFNNILSDNFSLSLLIKLGFF